MKLNITSPQKSLNKAYLKQGVNKNSFEIFIEQLKKIFARIDEDESEEFQKNIISDFLKECYYKDRNEINTLRKKDLVIHLGKTSSSPVGIIIETKSIKNTPEMISIAKSNVKALHELMLYYCEERYVKNNKEIKYLIATNVYDWFIFDASVFENLFTENGKFVESYKKWSQGLYVDEKTKWFYKEIAKEYIYRNVFELPCTHFNIKKFGKILKNNIKPFEDELIILYKIFSPEHLLKEPFANDSNTLNREFYNELLHIIGLEETKEGNKKLIHQKGSENRDPGSLIENTINILKVRNKLSKLENKSKYGETEDNQYYNAALELCITWLNRILFLKLLEGQLIKYHKGDKQYSFMNSKNIKDFDELDELFFEVLAVQIKERPKSVKDKYGNIPYLNSSLFENTDLEQKTVQISDLKDRLEISIYNHTVLKDSFGTKITGNKLTLHYLLEFLEAYDFSSDSTLKVQEQNKTIINASVLGLIFEKINGYKDGSYYTPGFVTMYMCKETIRSIVIKKFNEKYKCNCKNLDEVYNKIENIKEANEIINSIKICDPAVGSGHFLVSALNEIIAIKSDLKILCDRNGRRLKDWQAIVENDELVIYKEDSDKLRVFEYKNPKFKGLIVKESETQIIQEALFQEKQTIIENCLFGLDINPNSVKICRLRLWIELLKNAYYTKKSNYTELETLPNIDINIKQGNSLINRFSVKGVGLIKKGDRDKLSALIEKYKIDVWAYKSVTDKKTKDEIRKRLENYKKSFEDFEPPGDEDFLELQKKKDELEKNVISFSFFEETKDKKNQREKLALEVKKLEEKYSEKLVTYYSNAFEWRFEFPEILDDNGQFVGFDIIIGNPPYIQVQKLGEYSNTLSKQNFITYDKTGDIYVLFYEKGISLLKKGGILVYITSNKWMRAAYGEKLRSFLIKYTNPVKLVDFGGYQVFESVTVDTNILIIEKDSFKNQVSACVIERNFNRLNNMSDYFSQNECIISNLSSENSWVVLNDVELRIKEKIEKIGIPLKNWNIQINYGIKTGFNEAFIILENERKKMIEKCPKAAEIIRPILRGKDIKKYKIEFSNLWLINTHNGIKEDGVERVNVEKDYPIVYEHLLKYKNKLVTRLDKGDDWTNLRNCAYLKEFEKPKIIFPNMTKYLPFYFDNENFYTNQKCFIITGENIAFLNAFLNSSVFKYCFRENFPELQGGTRELSKIFFDKIPVLNVNKDQNNYFEKLILEIQKLKRENRDTEFLERQIDDLIFNLYDLKTEERKEIGFIKID